MSPLRWGLSQSRILQAAGGGRGTLSYDIDAQSGSVYPTELFSLNFNSRELAYLGGGQTYVAGGTASFALTWKVIDETTPTAMTMSASFNIIVVDSPTFAQDDIDALIGGYSFPCRHRLAGGGDLAGGDRWRIAADL